MLRASSLRLWSAAMACVFTTAAATTRAEPPSRTDWVVVAPHPDDAVLLAAGVLLRARQNGEHVAVVLLTNGDFDCRVDGLVREGESIDGLAEVGVGEDSVYFLGYPDGYLARLGRTPLGGARRLQLNKCVPAERTYGNRGHAGRDLHATVHGVPAAYTAENVVSDLALLLGRLRPRRLIVTHPNDTHPDHAAAYVLVRRAIDRLSFAPWILTGIVHNGDCWPTGSTARAQCPPARIAPAEALPPLTGALARYGPELRLDVPSSCLSPSFETNPKLRAIAAHRSQTHDDRGSYLFAFARRDELFFAQALARGTDGHYEPIDGDFRAALEPVARIAPPVARTAPDVLVRTRVSRSIASVEQSLSVSPGNTGSSGEYTLDVDPSSEQASVFENSGSRAPTLLRRWPLPHDSFSRGPETFTLEREYTAGNAVELALYESGVLVGVHVAVKAPGSP